MVYQFLSTMVSENGFLLVSGSGRKTFTVLDETQKDSSSADIVRTGNNIKGFYICDICVYIFDIWLKHVTDMEKTWK